MRGSQALLCEKRQGVAMGQGYSGGVALPMRYLRWPLVTGEDPGADSPMPGFPSILSG
jgi:hypothetical protein